MTNVIKTAKDNEHRNVRNFILYKIFIKIFGYSDYYYFFLINILEQNKVSKLIGIIFATNSCDVLRNNFGHVF